MLAGSMRSTCQWRMARVRNVDEVELVFVAEMAEIAEEILN